MISLNYRDSRPIYEQIRDGLRKLIVTGALSADEKLPSVRALAAQLAINPNTIQRAYNELEGEGYIYSVPGKGSFAAANAAADAPPPAGRRTPGRGHHTQPRDEGGRAPGLVTLRRGDRGAGLRPAGGAADPGAGAPLRAAVSRGKPAGAAESGEGGESVMIEVNGLVKRFDGFAALDGAALSVPAGSVYGLVGPNGAGKSTLIRHLTGIFRQDAGTVRIGGEDVWENAALKARIAAIPDDWYYFLQSSIRDMMRFYRGFYPAFSMERYEKLKEVFQLDEKRPIRRLSKGMQKQAAFWLALCCMPDYLILDEPVDGLDPVMRRQVWSLVLADVAQRGTTVLVSSHNLRELEDVCDHVGIMDHGRVLLERSLAQLQDNMVKLQVVFPDGMTEVPSDLPVLHASQIGRIHTFIMRMSAQEAEDRLAAYSPLLVDAVPLTLEEIFIYELGGADYAVKDIVL